MRSSQTPEKLFDEGRMEASVQTLWGLLPARSSLALILGSGWGGVKQLLEDPVAIPLAQVPHFPCPKVSGHGGEFVLGRIGGQSVLILSGRKHLYEGEGLEPPLYPIEVFRRLGVKTVGLTNAAGAAQRSLKVGDLMVIRDHLDSTWHRYTQPLARLAGAAPDCAGTGPVYDTDLVQCLLDCGQEAGLPVRSGVYGFTLGPFYETAAEVRCLGAWGCDAIGMSTVPEATYARLCGMRVFALSGITNMGTGLTQTRHSHESVKEQATLLAPRATKLLERFVASLS